MPEVNKRKILLASVLKPVNDTRMAEKIGQSLAETKEFDVYITGFPSSTNNSLSYKSHPLPRFRRLGFKRLAAGLIILRKIIAIKPHLIIITTHELIWISLIAKLLVGCKVIYDVQENYFRNILHTRAFPYLFRPFIASYVRMKEYICAPFIDHFFLAEKAYEHELTFHNGRFTVLENKIKRPVLTPQRSGEAKHFLFSGTLAETTGVFKAIEIAVRLFDIDKDVTLTLIGHCSQKEVLRKIKSAIEPYPFIKLIGGDELVPHQQIVEYIQRADAGIIAYPRNASTYNAVPTKLFEYLGYELPVILTNHPGWAALCESCNSAVVFDPDHINAETILKQLRTQTFYTKKPTDVFWDSEEEKLYAVVNRVLNIR